MNTDQDPGTPITDEIEEFLKQQNELREREGELDPKDEALRKQVKEFDKMEDRILELAVKYCQRPDYNPDCDAAPDLYVAGGKQYMGYYVIDTSEVITGIGRGMISLDVDDSDLTNERAPNNFVEQLGINFRKGVRGLSVGLHRDIKTMNQAQLIYNREKGMNEYDKSIFDTRYYFDNEGNFVKLVIVGGNIPDERPKVGMQDIEGNKKAVLSPMEKGEPEIIGATLQHLIKRMESLIGNPPPLPQV